MSLSHPGATPAGRPAAGRPGHDIALQQAPHGSQPATPTAYDKHAIGLLPPQPESWSGRCRLRVRSAEAIPEVRHVQLKPMRLQGVAATERVGDAVVVVGEPEALRCALHDRRSHDIDIAKVPKQGKARVVIPQQAHLVYPPQVTADAYTQRRALELIVHLVLFAVKALIFRARGAVKDIRTAGVAGVHAVVCLVAVEVRALFQHERQFQASTSIGQSSAMLHQRE